MDENIPLIKPKRRRKPMSVASTTCIYSYMYTRRCKNATLFAGFLYRQVFEPVIVANGWAKRRRTCCQVVAVVNY